MIDAYIDKGLTAEVSAVTPVLSGVSKEELNALDKKVDAKAAEQTAALTQEAERAQKAENSIKAIALNLETSGVQIQNGELQFVKSNINGTQVVVDKIPAATNTTAGIMSAEDKAKLDNLSQGGVVELIEEVTYNELVALRDNSKLRAGMKYRITDYVTTTIQENTKSANHPFDVIVEAVSENELSELAQAIQHEGDTYFDGNDLDAWQLWYSLDNDTSRFIWADAENGKGVIYRMIDEKRNDCPYDFKNIMFKDYFTFSYIADGVIYDGTVRSEVKYCYGNIIKPRRLIGVQYLNNIVFKNTGFANNCYSNTFGDYCYNNTFSNSCYNNTFSNSCYNNTFSNYCYSNTFGDYCYSNTFSNSCHSNTFSNSCYNNTFSNYCYNNTFSNSCYNNTFSNYCYNNTFGDYCYSNTFSNSCYSNTFGDYCNSNTFGDDCNSNTFGDDCYNRRMEGSRLSITLNDEYYDDGSGQLIPMRHPDLSTQPSILPYKFMGNYVYEQLVPIEGETTAATLAVAEPFILEARLVGNGFSGAADVEYTNGELHITASNLDKALYLKIEYTAMENENNYYGYGY